MASEVDLQRLVVQMEASFVKYQREWSKAVGSTDANVKRVQSKFDGMNATISRSGAKAADGLKPVSLQTSNIAAQFQDIAVQLQAGQSPFTIALQQGTQLSAALGSNVGLKGALAGISAGFGAMLSPVSLATIAVIALGGAAVQWLGSMQQKTETVDERLKRHREMIASLVQGYDRAGKAAEDYYEQANKAPVGSAISNTEEQHRQALVRLNEALSRVLDQRQEFEGFARSAKAFGVPEEVAQELNRVSAAFNQMAADGALSREEVDRLHTELTTLQNNTADQNIKAIAQKAIDLVNAAREAGVEVGHLDAILRNLPRDVEIKLRVGTEFGSSLKELQGLFMDPRSSFDQAREAAKNAYDQLMATAQSYGEVVGAANEYQRVIESIDAAERASKSKSSSKDADKLERERQAVKDLIADLQFEQSIIGKSIVDQEALRAVRQAGAAATAEQRAQIDELVRSNFTEQQQVQALQDAYEQLGEIGKAAFNSIVKAMADGKIEGNELLAILGDIASQLGQMFINNAFSSLTGGGGFDISKLFGGFRAGGGPVDAGKAYVVGEKRPELFVPRTAGTIIPQVPGGGAGGAPVVHVSIDARGAQIGAAEQIRQFARFELPALIQKGIQDPHAVG